jgi:prepilin-type N-terminal cleavage/methylation domain-containing protein
MRAQHARSTCRRRGRRAGFTLIELVLVVLVILILTGLTVAVVARTTGGDRVRSGTRQVQNYLAGARDRAIYAASRLEEANAIPPATGVRFLPDPAIVDLSGSRPFSSMIFIQETPPLTTQLRVYENTANPGEWLVSQINDQTGQPLEQLNPFPDVKQMQSLIDRGLIERNPNVANGYRLPVRFDVDSGQETFFVFFTTANLTGGWLNEGQLSKNPTIGGHLPGEGYYHCRFRLSPAPLPSEEPRLLPRGSVVDVASSRVGGMPLNQSGLIRNDGSFDILFNYRGVVHGPLAAAGLIHLVVVDGEDIERGFNITLGQVTLDGQLTERRGEEFIVSLRTQTGSVYVSDVNPSGGPTRSDPFFYAEGGGEAK